MRDKNDKEIHNLLRKDEGLGIEFRLCSGAVEHDVFDGKCNVLA